MLSLEALAGNDSTTAAYSVDMKNLPYSPANVEREQNQSREMILYFGDISLYSFAIRE